ncbi:hypothetical protein AMS62_10035 [Bacillus sp. FJAT-18019]|nr:hypothetical protein AMS62_10035 [Bacillus sp. FJAT-18019]
MSNSYDNFPYFFKNIYRKVESILLSMDSIAKGDAAFCPITSGAAANGQERHAESGAHFDFAKVLAAYFNGYKLSKRGPQRNRAGLAPLVGPDERT